MKRNGDKYIRPEIKNIIKGKNMKCIEVAKYIGISNSQLSRSIKGKSTSPISNESIYKLCELLQVNESDVIYTYKPTPDKINEDELWKELVMEGCNGMYLVSNMGRIWSVSYNKELKQNVDRNGYCRVTLEVNLKTTEKKIHILVAKVFIPNPNGLPEIDHIDGNKKNNRVDNLEWVTGKENVNRAVEKGLHSNTRVIRVVETGEIFNTIAKFKRVYQCKSNSSVDKALNKGKIVKGVHIEYV